MKTIRSRMYKPFIFSRVSLVDEPSITFSDQESKDCIALYFIKGEAQVIDSVDPNYNGTKYSSTDLKISVPQPIQQTWSVSPDIEWICIQTPPGYRWTHHPLGYQKVSGSFTLPANTGFCVISGSVTADGIVAQQDDFFRLRDQPIEITGDATLILVSKG